MTCDERRGKREGRSTSTARPRYDRPHAGGKAKRGASRYDAVIATLVGFCALCVSGQTAYMQRQQVRATVWPILEFDTGNGPIRFTLPIKASDQRSSEHSCLIYIKRGTGVVSKQS